jgi:adenylate cyclase
VDEMREALRRAESFGDMSGIIPAQFACGTALLRAGTASHDEATEVLETARAGIQKHRIVTYILPIIVADLAVDAVRNGRRDQAVDELRALFALHISRGHQIVVGSAGEALVTLLIDRRATDDLAEAHRIIDEWEARRPGIPALDLWWLKSRALLAKAEGDRDGYAGLAKQYLELCEKLDARGRLTEAHRMVGTTAAADG